jgi:hypothetical protein
MKNEEIVLEIYKKYNIIKYIKSLIKNSINDYSYQDLEQIIYIALLTMDNNKLNNMFFNNELIKWINKTIKNKRNGNKYKLVNKDKINYYTNEYKDCVIHDHREATEEELIIDEHNYYLDWLDYILNDYYDWNDKNLTQEKIKHLGNFEILKFWLSTHYSMGKIAKQFNCGTTKINKMINEAKEEIKRLKDLTYDDWLEKTTKNYYI